MELDAILTQRGWEKRPSFDLVYSWEDLFARGLGVPFLYRNRVVEALYRRLPGKPQVPVRRNCFLMEMEPHVEANVYNRKNIIPYWIDFFLRDSMLPALSRSYSRCPAVFVSSREVFEFLQSRQIDLPVYHLPLSLPDHCLNEDWGRKTYDLVMMGRPNEVLSGFFRQYVESHSCTYVYRRQEESRFLYFDQDGNCLGNLDTHERYMDLMRRCRIGLYATPGMDAGAERTGGFSQVTPRFLEYLSAGCHVVLRYVRNADTDFYGLERFCPSIDTYEQFESRVDGCLRASVDRDLYRRYLAGHVTSARIRTLTKILGQI